MAWIYLLIAGFFEIGWPVGLKLAQQEASKFFGLLLAITCILLSGWFLFLAQKEIPIGTAYAVWTGIGAAGTFVIGVLFFGQPGFLINYLGVACIVLGASLLKLGFSA